MSSAFFIGHSSDWPDKSDKIRRRKRTHQEVAVKFRKGNERI